MLNDCARTAEKLSLAAIILQALVIAIGYITVIVGSNNTIGSLLFISIIALIGVFMIFLTYYYIYRRLRLENVRKAGTPSLVLGIILLTSSLILEPYLGIILTILELAAGILLILGYIRIRDSLEQTAAHPVFNQSV